MKHLSYTTSSKNQGSTQRLYRCFFVPSIYAMRPHHWRVALQSLEVCGKRKPRAVLGSRNTSILF